MDKQEKLISGQRLNNPAQWQKWKAVVSLYYKSKGTFGMLDGTIKEPSDPAELEKHQRIGYAMMADILKCIGDKYSCVVLSEGSPKGLWEKLESHIVGEKLVAIREVNQKLQKLRYTSGKMEDHLIAFNGLITEYQGLGGKLSESELANKLLESVPSTGVFEVSRLSLHREAIKTNGGELTLKEVNEELRLAASQKGEWSKSRETPRSKGFAFKGKVK
jgi:gag-polypeptide of LTR copia-type